MYCPTTAYINIMHHKVINFAQKIFITNCVHSPSYLHIIIAEIWQKVNVVKPDHANALCRSKVGSKPMMAMAIFQESPIGTTSWSTKCNATETKCFAIGVTSSSIYSIL